MRVYKEVDVEIDVDTSGFSTEELIDEIESRGLRVQDKDEVESEEDRIHDLYRDYLQFREDQISVSYFQQRLNKFFEHTIDKYIV